MFLATTALSEFWDPQARLLFLGSWCTLYSQREKWVNLNYRVLPNPWDDRDRFQQAGSYCQQVYEDLLAGLVPFLNLVHGVGLSKRYWRMLLGPWLLHYVDAFYDRYICLKEAFDACPELHTWLLAKKDYQTPANFEAFNNLNNSDLYNLQLYSQIIQSLEYTFPQRNYTPVASKDLPPYFQKRKILSIIKEKGRAFILKHLLSIHAHDEVVFTSANLDLSCCIELRRTPRFNGRFLQDEFPQDWGLPQGSMELHREELVEVLSPNDIFVKVLLESLPVNFPYQYFEGFDSSRQWILQQYVGKRFPKVLLTLAGLWHDAPARFLAAEIAEKNGKIINIQHGAGYGMTLSLGVERHERDISDRFYCWGWSRQEDDPKLSNLPSSKLCIREREVGDSGGGERILMVGTTYPRYLPRFQSFPVGSHWEEYLEAPLAFLQVIGKELREKVLYRGHVIEFGWYIAQRLQEQFPLLAIDDHHHSFRQRMNNTRLVVIDHPGTTFLEAMAGNVPLIMFYDPHVWEMREAALPYFESLREVAILHLGPETAALHARQIYADVDDWWFSSPVQKSRRQFVEHFALSGSDWNVQWTAMVRRELAEVG